MKEIYLIRHGESIFNVEKKFCGWNECDLSEKGYKQAQQMASNIKKLGIKRIYSSPLKRAYETAKAISDNIITDEGFKELCFGDFDGMTFEEVNKNHTNLASEMIEAEFDYTYPNGENRVEFFNRVTRTYEKILKNDNSDKIVIVCHSCVIRSILSKVFCSGPQLYFKLDIGNVGISKITHFEDDMTKATVVNYVNRELEID